MIESLVGGLVLLVAGQFSLLWYKLGKIEQKVKALGNHLSGINGKQDQQELEVDQ